MFWVDLFTVILAFMMLLSWYNFEEFGIAVRYGHQCQTAKIHAILSNLSASQFPHLWNFPFMGKRLWGSMSKFPESPRNSVWPMGMVQLSISSCERQFRIGSETIDLEAKLPGFVSQHLCLLSLWPWESNMEPSMPQFLHLQSNYYTYP